MVTNHQHGLERPVAGNIAAKNVPSLWAPEVGPYANITWRPGIATMHETVDMSIVEAPMAKMAAKWLWVREK